MTDTLSIIQRALPDSAANSISSTQVAAKIRVAIPGIIKSFDATKQTVVVQPAIQESVRLSGGLATLNLGLVADVPIVMPRAGGYSLTLPIRAGDECLLVIADRCIDAWFQSGGQQAPVEVRRHSISDAFAILGPWSTPRDLASYSVSAAQLRSDDGNTYIEVGANEITIKANTINVTGQTVNVTGSSTVHVSGAGNTTIEGKNFLAHTHTGVTAGGGVTGPVV